MLVVELDEGSGVEDSLSVLLEQASSGPVAETIFLEALAHQSILVILRQPPGEGDAAPQKNLVQFQRADGTCLVPLFTEASRVPGALPAPAKLVRVQMRVLLSVAGVHPYVINPLSSISWALTEKHLTVIKAAIAARGLSSESPSREQPWAFESVGDEWFPVALALAGWFTTSGRIDVAYLYRMRRLRSTQPPQVVLAIEEPVDLALASTLTEIAVQAGATRTEFVVRFLPEEPSHRAGIDGFHLEPFYRRPASD